MSRPRFDVLRPGAAVRIHGYAPARVSAVWCDPPPHPNATRRTCWAECRITGRRTGAAGRIGPHGYRPGEVVTVRAEDAVPRDLVRVARGSGRLWWPSFSIEAGP